MFVAVFVCCIFSSLSPGLSALNNRPIIGVMAQEIDSYSPVNATSYMMASYVKFLESGGARVVPIMIHKPESYYRDLLSKINGVLFPGGGNSLQSNGYGRTGKIIYDIAVEMNDKGDFFPLWGTCLGFELLNFLAAKKNWMAPCAAEDLAVNLDFAKGFQKSRLFSGLDMPLTEILMTQNVTVNYHHWCLTPANYTESHLDKYFKILATNKDFNGMTFVSAIEAYKYPFYGIAFHPEKVLFEWVLSETHHRIPHTPEAVEVSQYFSRFLVNEARKSDHHFPSKEAEDAVLIYNYAPMFTGKKKNYPVMQDYYFF